MADNIQFLRGEQSKLNTLTTFTEGAFYLTTDSDRLYYAKSSTELAYLNKYITTVATVNDLPKNLTANQIGDFYYITSGNILCFYNGGATDSDSIDNWTQVNAQTVDTDTKVGSFTIAETTADNTGVTFTYTLSQVDKAGHTVGTNISNTFKIEKADINALVDHPVIKVGLSATQITNGAKISTVGNGNDSDEFINIKGGGNVTVTVNGDDITISAKDEDTKYSLEVESLKISEYQDDEGQTIDIKKPSINLKDDSGDIISTVLFSNYINDTNSNESNDDIEITNYSGNEVIGEDVAIISISHKDYNSKRASGIEDQTVGNGDEITILKDVTVSNGHVTGVTTAKVTLDFEDTNTDTIVKSVAADNTGKITIGLKDKDGEDAGSVVSGKDLFYTLNGKTIYNKGDLTTDIKDYVEQKLMTVANAMTFKGGISNSTLPTSASIGDTYIITTGSVTTADGETATAGDIIIAYSSDNTEQDDGTIAAAKLKWTVVPGEEENTTYTLEANANTIVLKDDSGNAASTLTLADDDVVLLTSANGTITAEHKTYTVKDTDNITAGTATLSHKGTFTAVTGFTSDEHGHVTKVNTTKFTLPELLDQTNDHTLTTSGNTTTLQNAAGADKGSITINDGNKIDVVAATTGVYTINHTGSAATQTTGADVTTDTINIVTAVKTDAYGHATEVITQKYNPTDNDTKYKLSGTNATTAGTTVSANSNVATVKEELKTEAGAVAGTMQFKVASAATNIEVTAANQQINFNLVWGSF